MEKAEGTHGELGAQAELTPVLVISPSRSPSSLNCQILVLRHRRGRVTGMDGVTRHGLRLRHTLRAQRGQKLPLPSHRRDHYAGILVAKTFFQTGKRAQSLQKGATPPERDVFGGPSAWQEGLCPLRSCIKDSTDKLCKATGRRQTLRYVQPSGY